MKTVNVLAMDYGASNGRGIIGGFDGEKLVIEEIHRFPNHVVSCMTGMYWDILSLFNEIKNTLLKVKNKSIEISSVGIDTWALDFGVLDSQGNLLGNPHSYRDPRVNEVIDEVFRTIPAYEIFSKTGMIPSTIFTLFQIVSMKYKEKAFLEKGDAFLFMPDLLNYFLTGFKSCDSTQASSSLLYSPFTKSWITEFSERLGIPNRFPDLIKPPGHVVGNISRQICDETGVEGVPVISVASHDTASAIAAVPAVDKENVVYISCGTWSVLGTSLKQPFVSEEAMSKGFNNEIGYNEEIMFVKNITGLWILQECEREWAVEGYKVDYRHMIESAEQSTFDSWIDVESGEFSQPGNMCMKVAEYCKRTGQQIPGSKEEIFKCIIMGLAHKYKETIDQLAKLLGKQFSRIHIIGGGSRNGYLCRITSKLTGLEVVAGPYEAAATGNIIAQLITLGYVKNASESVDIIKKSFPLERY